MGKATAGPQDDRVGGFGAVAGWLSKTGLPVRPLETEDLKVPGEKPDAFVVESVSAGSFAALRMTFVSLFRAGQAHRLSAGGGEGSCAGHGTEGTESTEDSGRGARYVFGLMR